VLKRRDTLDNANEPARPRRWTLKSARCWWEVALGSQRLAELAKGPGLARERRLLLQAVGSAIARR
jgi:hypothetical protein